MGQLDFEHGWNVTCTRDPNTCKVAFCEWPKCNNDDVPSYDQACMGVMVCPHCGKAVLCGDIAPTGEDETMIHRSNNNDRIQAGNQRGNKKRTGFRYLSADMLSSAHQVATIADARNQPDTFRRGQESLVLKLKFKGEFILWTLRDGNPCLDSIVDVLGEDETKFKGAELELYTEEDQFDGKKWIRVDVVPSTVTPSKRAK